MRVFQPLRRGPVALLWLGQVLSNLGDEVYGIGGDRTHIARTYRLCMSLDYAAMVVAFVISPWLFERLGIAPSVLLCGAVVAGVGLAGLLSDADSRSNELPRTTGPPIKRDEAPARGVAADV